MAPAARHGKLVRWLVRGIVGLLLVVFSLVVIVLLALDLRPTREFVRAWVNAALADTFKGQVLLDRIGSLRLDAVGGIDARVLDAERRPVITLRGLRVRSNWPEMVRSLLLGRPLHVGLDPLSVDHLDIAVIADKDGVPTLASAFEPRHPEPAQPVSNEPSTSVAIDGLHVRHLWAHGSLPSVPVIDAEYSNLRGSFALNARGLAAKISGGQLQARGLPARVDPRGELTANVALPPETNAAFRGTAKFVGKLASAPATLNADWKGPELKATLLSPAVPPETLRELLPGSKLEGTTKLEARVEGRLPQLEFHATVGNPALTAKVDGRATLEDTTRVTAELVASDVNLAAVLADTPSTRLSATASATATIGNLGDVKGDYRISVASGRVGENDTPALASTGQLTRDTDGALRVQGKLDVEEPGAPTHADYRLHVSSRGETSLDAELAARLNAPPRLKRLTELQLTGPLTANVKLDLSAKQLSAHVKSELEPVVHPSARLAKVELRLDATGALSSPQLELRADARGVAAAGRRFQRVRVTAFGKPEQLRVTARVEADRRGVQAEGLLVLADNPKIEGLSLLYSDPEGHVAANVRQVRLVGSKTYIDDLALRGVGELYASGSVSPQRIDAQFTSKDLDLARLSRLSGVDLAKKGKLSLEGKVAGPLDALEGEIKGRARELDVGAGRTGQFDVDLKLQERKLDAELSGEMGHSRLTAKITDLDLPKAPYTPERLQALRGELLVEGKLDLKQLAPALRALKVPLERARGQLTLDVRAANPRSGEDAGKFRLEARVKSEGLALVSQRAERESIDTPSEARDAKPLAVEGIDLDLHATLEPNAERAELHLSLLDAKGPLLALDAEAKVKASLIATLNTPLDTMPLRVSVRAPERPMEKLPSAVRPAVMRGLASFELDAEGTARDPKLHARFAVRRLQAREGRNSVDVYGTADYASTGGALEGRASTTRGGSANLSSQWRGNLLERVRQPQSTIGGANAFELDGDLVLDKFPLAVVPDLSDNQVRGPLSGEVHLRGLGKDAKLNASFDGSGIRINRVAMPELRASLQADAQKFTALFDAKQSTGSAHAEFSAPSAWGARWAPELEPRANVRLQARSFELEALAPLVMRYVSTLEGKLDADMTADLQPERPQVSGTATLTEGVFQLPQVGQRFSDVKAKVSVRDGEIRVDDIQARGITGRLTAEARAKLEGTQLRSASARIEIKAKEKLPVTFEGVMIGDAWGHATLAYTAREKETDIKIEVPDFRLQMPEAAQNSVQDLEPAEGIRVGAHRADGKFVVIPLQPLDDAGESDEEGSEPPSITRVHVHLGNSVWIDRGRQASVQLTGDLEVQSGAEQQVRGRIELRGGKLDVSGKQFEIERGVISFEGDDPANPTITATARWDSPAGYTVYADYAGTVKDGKLKLRAEPSLTQDEILSLLLFGAPTGSMAAGSGDSNPGGTAVGVAGGTATQGLNRAISDVTSLDVSTRIDTSTGSARPELVVQLTPRLTTRVTRAIGEPAPGQSPDRTFLTLELRLKRSWAISAVIGDHGASALDLIWRKRY